MNAPLASAAADLLFGPLEVLFDDGCFGRHPSTDLRPHAFFFFFDGVGWDRSARALLHEVYERDELARST